MSNLIHNERVKLTAGWLNTLSGGLMAAGVFTPLAALVLGALPVSAVSGTIPLLSIGCLMLGIALHFIARAVLGRLRP